MMKFRLHIISLITFLAFLTVSCREDIILDNNSGKYNGDETPVEFFIDIHDYLSTKGIANPKRSFVMGANVDSKEGDVIHITGTFQLNSTAEIREVTRYGALKLTKAGWVPLGSNPLTWPNAAVSGNFTAYYIPVSNGVLPNDGTPVAQRLDNIDPSNDPLKAEFTATQYGMAIKLNFSHLCSYLSIVEMPEGVSNQFIFTSKNENNEYFNNAYQISLTGTDLKFEFVKNFEGQGNTDFPYLMASLNNLSYFDKVNGETLNSKGVSFFLQPGYYGNFSLLYPRSSSSFYDYLSFNYDEENFTDATSPDLMANTPYILNITQSSGIIIDSLQEEDQWDENGENYDINVEEFLKAVANGENYYNNDHVQILEATLGGGTRLLHNVDFKNEHYVLFDDDTFSPNVTGGTVFDGGYHYISNLGCPLFRYNYGTIRNLGINGVNTDVNGSDIISSQYTGTDESAATMLDNSRNGIICDWNRSQAIITNVKIKGEVNFKVKISNDMNYDGTEVHNIGGLVGSNSNIVENIQINTSSFNVSISNYDSGGIEDNIVVAGIYVGQNTASLTNISLTQGNNTLTNNCTGKRATYNIGGCVGTNSGFISDITLIDVSVNCSNASGVRSYIGGLAGSLATESSTDGENAGYDSRLQSCLVSGTVTAGSIVNDYLSSLKSESFTGGLIGHENAVAVVQCRTACSVITPLDNLINEGIYATGGIFGRILSSGEIKELTAYGPSLVGPDNPDSKRYIGTFSGLLPEGESWTNYQNNEIILKSFDGISQVGGSLAPTF